MNKKYSFIYIIIAATLWGIEGVLLLPHLYSLPVALVVFVQTTILTVLLTPFFIKRFKHFKKLTKKDWLIISGLSFLGGVIGIIAITKSFFFVNYVNLSIVVLIQKLQPVFAILLAGIFLKEKLNSKFLLWSGLALFGAYIMTFGFSLPNMNTGGNLLFASALALIAAVSFASTTVLTRTFLQKINPLDGTYLRFALSALFLGVIILLTGDYSSISQISTENMKYFSIIVVTGGIGIFLYNLGLKSTKASIGTLCELAFPLTAILLEFFVRGNILSSVQWIGVVILFVSVGMITPK
ncbi:DMT family transporter [Candidatus Gracilibacteria bacterium]|nr:DMT family transporter [Candidatus Gracilibacteria bacterium]